MSENSTPVVEKVADAPVAPKPSPAQDLRDIQNLLLGGMFPGQVSPQVVKSFSLLETMAREIEAKAAAGTNEPK